MAKPPAGSSLFNRGPLFQEPPSPPKDEGSTPPQPDGGPTTPVNTQPPAGSSLLFSALADSGKIKQRKNGTYLMVLKGVDEIDWFTDRPFGSEGLWKPQKLIRQWDSLFESSDPNAQASFRIGDTPELMTFEMFKPKYNSKKQILSFKLDAGIINNLESDLVTGLKAKRLMR